MFVLQFYTAQSNAIFFLKIFEKSVNIFGSETSTETWRLLAKCQATVGQRLADTMSVHSHELNLSGKPQPSTGILLLLNSWPTVGQLSINSHWLSTDYQLTNRLTINRLSIDISTNSQLTVSRWQLKVHLILLAWCTCSAWITHSLYIMCLLSRGNF